MEPLKFSLPKLPYANNALAPYISEQQLVLHHDKHHQKYVTDANNLLEKINKARQENADIDTKALTKELSFNIGGHILHSIFWTNLAPVDKGGGGNPTGKIAELINSDFGSFERFKKEFSQAATTTEGSGWAVLTVQPCYGKLVIGQIEKHNVNVYPGFTILLALDIWEHAYYLDYKNERPKFVEAFWNIINWESINMTLKAVM